MNPFSIKLPLSRYFVLATGKETEMYKAYEFKSRNYLLSGPSKGQQLTLAILVSFPDAVIILGQKQLKSILMGLFLGPHQCCCVQGESRQKLDLDSVLVFYCFEKTL